LTDGRGARFTNRLPPISAPPIRSSPRLGISARTHPLCRAREHLGGRLWTCIRSAGHQGEHRSAVRHYVRHGRRITVREVWP
jgi:hypothetical protein